MSTHEAQHGFWINYEDNPVIGATLSLPSEWGALLITSLAVLVGLAGVAAWTIAAFLIHRARCTHVDKDLLFHQEQAIIADPLSSLPAAWQLYKLRRKYVKQKPRGMLCRRLIFLVPLSFYSIFLAASIFVAKDATPNYKVNYILVKPGECGILHVSGNSRTVAQALGVKVANDSRIASAYVDQCYQEASPSGCANLPIPRLPYTTNFEADCPFSNTGRCLLGHKGAIQMITDHLDSNEHFGINAPPEDRITYRRSTSCSPMHAKDLVQSLPDTTSIVPDFRRLEYYLGPIIDSTGIVINFTNVYLTRNVDASLGYDMTSVFNTAGDPNPGWLPIEDLSLQDAEVSLHFFSPNSAHYRTRVFDPFFSANGTHQDVNNGNIYYLPDQYVNIMGCADQVQLCKSDQDCTLFLSDNQVLPAFADLGPSDAQLATAARIIIQSATTYTYSTVSGQAGSALQAEKKLIEFISLGLPDNQWQLEVVHWFETGLANMQHRVVDFVENSWAKDSSALTVLHPDAMPNITDGVRSALKAQCNSQRLQSTLSTQSFNFLGFIIVVVICPITIIVSWVLEPCVDYFEKNPLSKNHHRYVARQAHKRPQLLRMAMETHDGDVWDGSLEGIPYRDGLFPQPRVVNDDHGKPLKLSCSPPRELQDMNGDVEHV